MDFNYRKKVDTKKKALKLIYDPTCLLRLLYSKYGYIKEDYYLLMINQLVYDSSSHFNIFFKEYQFLENIDEYLKRFYALDESTTRVPKLSDYYKNYHKFFCRPNFNDFIISDLMVNYGDDKAELFYKRNFELTNSEISEKNNISSLSSLDDITNNKTIFTKKNLFIIEKNEKSINYSMTLTLNNTTINNIQNNKKNLVSARSLKDSFEQIVHNLVYYKKKNKNQNKKKKKKESRNKNNIINEFFSKKESEKGSIKLINTINYLEKNKTKSKKNNIINNNFIINKDNITKTHNIINNNNVTKIKGHMNNNNILNTILKIFNSPKKKIRGNRNTHKTKFHSKFEEYNNNCNELSHKNYIHLQRNKIYNLSQNYSLNNHSGGKSICENVNHKGLNSKVLRKTTSQNQVKSNYILTFSNINNKQVPKKKKKNKTFDSRVYNQINQINSMPFLKNKIVSTSNIKINTQNKQYMNIIRNNNFIGSKFNLIKNKKNTNNYIEKNKSKKQKQTSYNYYQNILNKIIPSNKIKTNKSKISFGININNNTNNNTSNSSIKNKSISPINSSKEPKANNNNVDIRNINRQTKNQINNFNINFNNVYFTSKPTSYIIDNNTNNKNIINNSHLYNSINIKKNINNNSLNNNITNNNFINSNILEHDNKSKKNLYVMNLKNIYNFSRNKNNILINNPLTQTESHHTKIQNNYNIIHNPKNNYCNRKKDSKILTEKNITNGNLNYKKVKDDIINSNKNNISNKKNKYQENPKISKEIINFIRNAQINFVMRNKNKNNIEFLKSNKILKTGDDINKNRIKNNKSLNCLNNIYSSSSATRRNNKSKKNINYTNRVQNPHSYGKKISSLTSQKNIKSKYKKKIQQ